MIKHQTLALNKRLIQLKASPTLAINELSAKLIDQGKKVIRFGFGQSPFPVPDQVVEALQKHSGRKEYLPVQGLQKLRTAVSDYYKVNAQLTFHPDRIHVGPGSKELIYQLLLAIDATLLLPRPSWVSYAPQAILSNTPYQWIDTFRENDWKVTAQDIESLVLAQPDQNFVILLNYPNNPVGHIYSQEEIIQISEVCRSHQIIVIADEIYHEIYFKQSIPSFSTYLPERTIITTGLSKWCGAGGWRLGLALLPESLKPLSDLLLKIASETYTCASTPIQYAAVYAYQTHSEEIEQYKRTTRAILKFLGDYSVERLRKIGLKVARPGGGFYVYPDFSDILRSKFNKSADLCNALLEEAGVALLPGVAFGQLENTLTARLSFVDFDGAHALAHFDHRKEMDSGWLEKYAPNVRDGLDRIERWINQIR
jgi:aspartate/methionine/tyrosine aminotransferase